MTCGATLEQVHRDFRLWRKPTPEPSGERAGFCAASHMYHILCVLQEMNNTCCNSASLQYGEK